MCTLNENIQQDGGNSSTSDDLGTTNNAGSDLNFAGNVNSSSTDDSNDPDPDYNNNNTSNPVPTDCAGVENGTAYLDQCQECVGGTTGKDACVKDCTGVYGGTAHLDDCQQCVGGTTGKTDCQIPCPTSKDDLKKVFPNASDANLQALADLLNKYGSNFGLDTKEKIQHFLAQAGAESYFFKTITPTENLRYSTADRLVDKFSLYFSYSDPNKRNPNDYVNNPEKLANYVYANRMLNGNEESGDGYKYRGRGILQLTGTENYTGFNVFYNNNYLDKVDIKANPNIVSSDQSLSIISALWYFKKKVLDIMSLDSNTSVRKVTIKVNGDLNGLNDRLSSRSL